MSSHRLSSQSETDSSQKLSYRAKQNSGEAKTQRSRGGLRLRPMGLTLRQPPAFPRHPNFCDRSPPAWFRSLRPIALLDVKPYVVLAAALFAISVEAQDLWPRPSPFPLFPRKLVPTPPQFAPPTVSRQDHFVLVLTHGYVQPFLARNTGVDG